MENAKVVNGNNFQQSVLEAKGPVLVDFYADWCGPCKALEPVIEELAEELEGRLAVARLNVDENQELSMNYGVQSIPTLILFSGGEAVERLVGFMPKAQLRRSLDPHLDGVAA